MLSKEFTKYEMTINNDFFENEISSNNKNNNCYLNKKRKISKDNDCNFIKKKLNRIDYSENNKQRIISQKINNIYNKTKNNNLKIVSTYGSKEKCFIF